MAMCLMHPEYKFGECLKCSDFRAHTCGDCAWAKIVEATYGATADSFVCRHRSSDLMWPLDTPACPAYIPREVQP